MASTSNAYDLLRDNALRSKGFARAKGDDFANSLTDTSVNRALKNQKKSTGGSNSGSSYRASNTVSTSDPRLPSLSDLYKQQYDNMEAQRKRRLDATIQANNDTARKNMNQAYIQYMLQQKNLPQQLRANGINGGAAETTIGDMNNTYMNNRNAIALNRANANAQRRLAYDNGVSGDYSQYLANMIGLANSTYGGGGSSRSSSSRSSSRSTASSPVSSFVRDAVVGQQPIVPVQTQREVVPRATPNVGFANVRAINAGANATSPTNMIRGLLRQGYTRNEIERMFGLGGITGGNGVR